MLRFLPKICLLALACILSIASSAAQTCTYGSIDHAAPEQWKHQFCAAPTFVTAPLSFAQIGSYPAQYLGKLQGGFLNSTASVTASVVGVNGGVSLANLMIRSTPPPSAPQGDTGNYLYGDITISAIPQGTAALVMNIMQEGVVVLTAADALTVPAAVQASCQQDVTAQVLVTSTQPIRLFSTQIYTQVVTLKNVGSNNLTGPLLLALGNLSPNSALFAGNGALPCGAHAGVPFQYAGSGLAAGASIKLVLTFTNSLVPQSNVVYEPYVLAGS